MNKKETETTNNRMFIDAVSYVLFGVFSFEFFRLIYIFIFALIGLFYFIYKAIGLFGLSNLPLTVIVPIITIFCFLLTSVILTRKFVTFRTIIEDRGITFIGFLKKQFIRWEEIRELGHINTVLPRNIVNGDIGRLMTSHGNYYFPLTMKEQDAKYPELSGKLMRWEWKDSKGNTKEITLENCPLYEEILRHLRSH